MEIRRRLGLNVEARRREKGLSQEQLAFEANLHRTYISGVERGVRNPTVVVLEKIAKALGVEASTLLAARNEAGRQNDKADGGSKASAGHR